MTLGEQFQSLETSGRPPDQLNNSMSILIDSNGAILGIPDNLPRNPRTESPENINNIVSLGLPDQALSKDILDWLSQNNLSIRTTLVQQDIPVMLSVKVNQEGAYTLELEYEGSELMEFVRLMDKMPAAVVLINPGPSEWPIVACSKAFAQMNGYATGEEDFSCIQNELAGEPIDVINEHSDERKSYYDDIVQGQRIKEATHKRKDGTTFPIIATTTDIVLDGNHYVVGFDFDMSNAVDQISRHRDYAHRASHDLKEPINIIVGYTSLLEDLIKEESIDRTSMSDFLHKIQCALGNMVYIIDGHLELAEGRAGQLESKNFSAFWVLESVMNNYLPSSKTEATSSVDSDRRRFTTVANNKQVAFDIPDTSSSGNDVYPLGDQKRVLTCLQNYISNAIKYGGDSPEISVYIEKIEDEKVKFSVTDRGKGIKPEDFPKLFIAYSRLDTKSGGNERSNGLGLNTVKTIIERLGGEVGVTSEIGKGSTFYFILPEGKQADT